MQRLSATEPFFVPAEQHQLAERVFTALARARFVSVASRLAFAGPRGLTLDLVDAWFAAGLIHRGAVRPDPLRPEEIQYLALTTNGARALAGTTGRAVRGIAPARLRRSSAKRAHDVFVGEVALAAITLGEDNVIDLVGVETDDRRLATSVVVTTPGHAPERVPLQPDALIVARAVSGPVALLVEVDRGTTAAKRMGRKYAAYLAWHAQGGPERDFGTRALRVLTLVPSEARLLQLHNAALAVSPHQRSGFLTFGLQDDVSVVTAERLVHGVARPLGGAPEARVPVLPAKAAAVAA